MPNIITLTIEAKDMPHGMIVRRTDFPPEESFFISAQERSGENIYFIADQAENGMIHNDYLSIPANTELDIQFKGLSEAISFVKKYNLENIW